MDLHLHTTFSDGAYSPGEVVDLARRSGLSAIAVTDHDTLAGIAPTRQAGGDALEIVAGVEITAEFLGREVHLLAYFVDPTDGALGLALDHLRAERVSRFHEMIARLRGQGVPIEESSLAGLNQTTSLGRPHVAALIVQAKMAGSMREAFQRYLQDDGKAAVPKARLPAAQAIGLVQNAGGVASWAHPNYHCTREALVEMKRLGLGAVEVEYPAFPTRRRKELRRLAAEAGLEISGGSDCHGPGQPHRAVGASSITHDELERLRARTLAQG